MGNRLTVDFDTAGEPLFRAAVDQGFVLKPSVAKGFASSIDFGELTSLCRDFSLCDCPRSNASRQAIALEFQNHHT
jgi:hypothetical protein